MGSRGQWGKWECGCGDWGDGVLGGGLRGLGWGRGRGGWEGGRDGWDGVDERLVRWSRCGAEGSRQGVVVVVRSFLDWGEGHGGSGV